MLPVFLEYTANSLLAPGAIKVFSNRTGSLGNIRFYVFGSYKEEAFAEIDNKLTSIRDLYIGRNNNNWLVLYPKEDRDIFIELFKLHLQLSEFNLDKTWSEDNQDLDQELKKIVRASFQVRARSRLSWVPYSIYLSSDSGSPYTRKDVEMNQVPDMNNNNMRVRNQNPVDILIEKFRIAWEDDVIRRNVLIFHDIKKGSLRYTGDFLENHCTVSGWRFGRWCLQLSQDRLLTISDKGDYTLTEELEDIADQLRLADFGRQRDEMRKLLDQYFTPAPQGWVSSVFRDTVLDFFTSPGISSEALSVGSDFHSQSYLIKQTALGKSQGSILLIFVPYLEANDPNAKFVLGHVDHLTLQTADFEVRDSNSARFLITPFLSLTMLNPIEDLLTTTPIFCLDAISVAYIHQIVSEGGKLSSEQLTKLIALTRGQASGILDLRRTWISLME